MNHVDITPRSWSGYSPEQMGEFVTTLIGASVRSPGIHIETLRIRRHRVTIILPGEMGESLPAPIAEVVERARARRPWDPE